MATTATKGDVEYQYRDKVLCKLVEDVFVPVVPPREDLINAILTELHASALGGHLSEKKLLQKVRSRFYWKTMNHDVQRFCKECPVCQQNRISTQKPYGLLQPLPPPDAPFTKITMDFVTHLLPTDANHDAIFTIVDRFSKFVRFIPTKTTISAEEAARLLFEEWICKYGMPRRIISDRDSKFLSRFWQGLMKVI